MYLSVDEYKELSDKVSDEKVLNRLLKQSERYIDILTYNRIKSIGFENCSDYEREIIKEVQSELIDFYFTNNDMINAFLSSYSLNGVTISMGDMSSNISNINGVIIPNNIYQKLSLTRFTSLIL